MARHPLMKQRARPIPYLLQSYVEKEIWKFLQFGQIEKIQNVAEHCFVSPLLITVKKDKSVGNTLHSGELNDSCIWTRPHMPNKEELLNEMSTEKTRVQNEPLWISKIDLENQCGQIKLSKETSRQGNFAITGKNMPGHYSFGKGFYDVSDNRQYSKKKWSEHWTTRHPCR